MKEIIYNILKNDPPSRFNSKYLFARVWTHDKPANFKKVYNWLRKQDHPDTILRHRDDILSNNSNWKIKQQVIKNGGAVSTESLNRELDGETLLIKPESCTSEAVGVSEGREHYMQWREKNI